MRDLSELDAGRPWLGDEYGLYRVALGHQSNRYDIVDLVVGCPETFLVMADARRLARIAG